MTIRDTAGVITASAMLLLVRAINPQSPPERPPSFEVASVKACSGGELAVGGAARGANRDSSGSARLYTQCQTVRDLILTAYGAYANGRVNPPPLSPVEGGPAWIDSEHYTIEAAAEGSASGPMMRGPMLQTLLETRFQLKVRRELRDTAGYALTVAKGGPKLLPHQDGSCVDAGVVNPLANRRPLASAPGERPAICGLNRSGRVRGPNVILDVPGVSLDFFARTFLGIAFPDRPVLNKTGLDGLFDIHLEFSPDENAAGPPDPGGGAPDATSLPAGPSIFSALQQQLGLKLEPARETREVLVIDHVEHPSEN